MTFDIETAINTILGNFTHANVTGVSGVPIRKYLSDDDLYSIPDRQTNGCIKFTQETLINKEKDGGNSTEENYLFFGHVYLDATINGMEFLSEINRVFNVNNQSITRTAEYIFTWESNGFTGAGLQDFSITIETEKYFVEDDV